MILFLQKKHIIYFNIPKCKKTTSTETKDSKPSFIVSEKKIPTFSAQQPTKSPKYASVENAKTLSDAIVLDVSTVAELFIKVVLLCLLNN